ncbi:hypothetical protein GWI33_015976 [Rhynchophorus ferrugineus]|uniref:Uncharacterized protein n=1 Tax=Rhynchophorus ferrugineus TaxID=354439 RepID=A0A834I4C8_RHYFE|nr:hypothetical protein GWI33_015976 [Rhynchophorus ferrugineus]
MLNKLTSSGLIGGARGGGGGTRREKITNSFCFCTRVCVSACASETGQSYGDGKKRANELRGGRGGWAGEREGRGFCKLTGNGTIRQDLMDYRGFLRYPAQEVAKMLINNRNNAESIKLKNTAVLVNIRCFKAFRISIVDSDIGLMAL